LKLLLPVFIPSWQFFKDLAPSPRIEFTLHKTAEEGLCDWQELNLRPQRLSIIEMLVSIFFNPRWNEALFIMNCAEQLIINPTEYGSREIMKRIQSELERRQVDLRMTPYLQFRLVFVSRENTSLRRDILFISKIAKISPDAEL
jgi:hypothetical protein